MEEKVKNVGEWKVDLNALLKKLNNIERSCTSLQKSEVNYKESYEKLKKEHTLLLKSK